MIGNCLQMMLYSFTESGAVLSSNYELL